MNKPGCYLQIWQLRFQIIYSITFSVLLMCSVIIGFEARICVLYDIMQL